MGYRSWTSITSLTAILEVYSLTELFELNDITEEEALDYLVTQGFLKLPDIQPIDFDD